MELKKLLGFEIADHPIWVVTSKNGSKINGQIATHVLGMTLVERWPRAIIFIGKDKHTHELILKSKVFALNLLSEKQLELVRTFGFFSGRKYNKFVGMDYKLSSTGCPFIAGCVGHADFKVVGQFDLGDHTAFIGLAESCEVAGKEKPLRISEFLKRAPKSWLAELDAMIKSAVLVEEKLLDAYMTQPSGEAQQKR